jgi:hypothetical protein
VTSDHPSEHELQRYGRGLLAGDDLLRVDDHVAACAACRDRAAAAARLDDRLNAFVSSAARDLADVEEARPSTAKGRGGERLFRWGAVAAIAASVLVAIGLFRGTRTPPTSLPATQAATASPEPADRLTPEERSAVAAALARGTLSIPDSVLALAHPQGALMGADAASTAFGPTAPIAEAVDDLRPTFTWEALDGATAYRVAVFDDQFNPVAESGWIEERTWTTPRPLMHGATYVWQVTARTARGEVTAPAPPAPEARFTMTTKEASARIASLRQRAAGSHLALAVLLAREGVLDEAERELNHVLQDAPNSTAAAKLREDLDRRRAAARSEPAPKSGM